MASQVIAGLNAIYLELPNVRTTFEEVGTKNSDSIKGKKLRERQDVIHPVGL